MKFILTKELGRLAKWLRILGFDSVYFKQDKISSLIIYALRDQRLILTRNQRLSQPKGVKILLINSEKIKGQIAEVLKGLKLKLRQEDMFSRCIICNKELVDIDKQKVKDRVPEYVYQTQDNFISCPECKRVYWPGTHWGNVKEILEEINSL